MHDRFYMQCCLSYAIEGGTVIIRNAPKLVIFSVLVKTNLLHLKITFTPDTFKYFPKNATLSIHMINLAMEIFRFVKYGFIVP